MVSVGGFSAQPKRLNDATTSGKPGTKFRLGYDPDTREP